MPRKPALPGVDRRQSILDAALVVFAQQGFEVATTKSIAEYAGVNQGLIYFYFASKADLFFAAFAYYTSSVLEEMDEIFLRPPELSPAASLMQVVSEILALLSCPPASYLVRILHQIMAGRKPEGELSNQQAWQAIGDFPRHLQQRLHDYLEACMVRGEFAPLAVDQVSLILTRTLIASVGQPSQSHQTRLPPTTLAETLAQLCCYGLLPRSERKEQLLPSGVPD